MAFVADGGVIGAIVCLPVRRTSSEGMVPPIVFGIVAAVVAGIFLSEFAGAHRTVGLPAALTVATVYVARSGLSNKAAGHWIGSDRYGSRGSDDYGDSGSDGGSGD